MKTKLSKLVGKVSYDAHYIFQLGPRASLYCQLRAKYWEDEHLRNLEIARYLTAGVYNKTLNAISEQLFALECDYLCEKAKVSREALLAEVA